MTLKKITDRALLQSAVERSRKEGIKWPQTPEGREYMRRSVARRRASGGVVGRRKKVASSVTEAPSTPAPRLNVPLAENLEFQIAYVYGRVESQLEVYANQLGIPFPELAGRLSELLRSKANGKMVRPAHRVSRLR